METKESITGGLLNFRHFDISNFGMGMSRTWFITLLCCPVLVPPSLLENMQDFQMHNLRLTMFIVASFVYFTVQFFPRLILSRQIKISIAIIAALIIPLPIIDCLIPQVSAFLDATPALRYIIWALLGFVTAVNSMLSYDFNVDFLQEKREAGAILSSIFAGILFILFQLLDYEVSLILIGLTPITVIGISLYKNLSKSINSDDNNEELEGLDLALTTYVHRTLGSRSNYFVFSSALFFGISAAIGSSFEYMQYSMFFVGIPHIAAGLILYLILKFHSVGTGRISLLLDLMFTKMGYALILPCATTCFLFLSFLSGKGAMIVLSLMFFVAALYNILNISYKDKDDSSTKDFKGFDFLCTEDRAFYMAGTALGWFAGTTVVYIVSPSYTPISYFSFAVIYMILSLIFIVQFNENELEKKNQAKESEEELLDTPRENVLCKFQDVCGDFSGQYSLSKRESEVFGYLARGHNREYISKKLCVSSSTIRYHAYNIYKKMDISNQQELIEMVNDKFFKL